jgi:hypothetical protein
LGVEADCVAQLGWLYLQNIIRNSFSLHYKEGEMVSEMFENPSLANALCHVVHHFSAVTFEHVIHCEASFLFTLLQFSADDLF